jgi:hypothetical protein
MAARLAARDQAVAQHIQARRAAQAGARAVPFEGICRMCAWGPVHPHPRPRKQPAVSPLPPKLSLSALRGARGGALSRPQGLEAAQLQSQRAALDAARAQQQQLHASYARLRDGFLALHAAHSPHNLSVAFGSEAAALPALTLDAAAYEGLTSRLLAARELAETDTDLVVARAREVLAQVRARRRSSLARPPRIDPPGETTGPGSSIVRCRRRAPSFDALAPESLAPPTRRPAGPPVGAGPRTRRGGRPRRRVLRVRHRRGRRGRAAAPPRRVRGGAARAAAAAWRHEGGGRGEAGQPGRRARRGDRGGRAALGAAGGQRDAAAGGARRGVRRGRGRGRRAGGGGGGGGRGGARRGGAVKRSACRRRGAGRGGGGKGGGGGGVGGRRRAARRRRGAAVRRG